MALHVFCGLTYGCVYENGTVGLAAGCFGWAGDYLCRLFGDNKALKAHGGASTWLHHRNPRDGRNGFIHRGNAQRGQEVQGSTSADWEQKAFCWFVVAEGCAASHDGGISSSFR